jgi:hypothetical protein
MSVDAFLELLDDLDRQAATAGPLIAATLQSFRARVEYGAGRGSVESLRETGDVEVAMLEQTGSAASAVAVRNYESLVVPWLEGDAAALERGARERVEATRSYGTRLYHANTLAAWAVALCEVGDAERASAAIAEARGIADPDDVADQIDLDLADAYAHALASDTHAARGLVERARRRAEGIDMLAPAHGYRYVEARVLLALGDVEGARRILEDLRCTYEERGFHRFAERYRLDLAALDGSP